MRNYASQCGLFSLPEDLLSRCMQIVELENNAINKRKLHGQKEEIEMFPLIVLHGAIYYS